MTKATKYGFGGALGVLLALTSIPVLLVVAFWIVMLTLVYPAIFPAACIGYIIYRATRYALDNPRAR